MPTSSSASNHALIDVLETPITSGQKTVTMTDPDRVKLQVAAVIGAVLGIVTYYVVGSRWLAVLLCTLIGAVHGPVTCYVVGGGWIGILLFGLTGAVVVGGAVSKLRVFR
jgi:hypothetical protein